MPNIWKKLVERFACASCAVGCTAWTEGPAGASDVGKGGWEVITEWAGGCGRGRCTAAADGLPLGFRSARLSSRNSSARAF